MLSRLFSSALAPNPDELGYLYMDLPRPSSARAIRCTDRSAQVEPPVPTISFRITVSTAQDAGASAESLGCMIAAIVLDELIDLIVDSGHDQLSRCCHDLCGTRFLGTAYEIERPVRSSDRVEIRGVDVADRPCRLERNRAATAKAMPNTRPVPEAALSVSG